MKTISKTTIRNATKHQLADYVASLSQDIPDYDEVSISKLRVKARACESKSRRWFGDTITFEEWANN